jgi:hypothetical protein
MEINNVSTYATWTALIVLILQVICKHFQIHIGESELTIIANAIIAFAIALWSSYNPNEIKWLGNAPIPVADSLVLNEEYVTGDTEDDI